MNGGGDGRTAAPTLSAIVPTLGHSPWLVPCLGALRLDGGDDLEILLVAPVEADIGEAEQLANLVLRTPKNAGFAGANNLGIAAAHGEYLATVNDDAIIDRGWCRGLLDALEQQPTAAAAQGINARLDDPATIDGAGLAWNHSWQAVQIGHGEPRQEGTIPTTITEIFGVSATAAIYRRSALAQLASTGQTAFDERLFAYYEDVDLACRLRGLGWQALLVPTTTVRHAGSVSGERLRGGKQRLIYRNRQLVLARLLGRAFWPRWPWILLRDAADTWQAIRRRDVAAATAIVTGLCATWFRWPGFARLGRPLVPLSELQRFGDRSQPFPRDNRRASRRGVSGSFVERDKP